MEAESLFTFAAQNKRLNVQCAGGEEPQAMTEMSGAAGTGASLLRSTPALADSCFRASPR